MKLYRLEPDLVKAGTYYILEETEDYTRTAVTIHSDIALAKRILDILNDNSKHL